MAGCGGRRGRGDDATQASAPLFDGPPVVVRVVDGDTGAPVGGVEVSGLRGGAVVARATSDGAGRRRRCPSGSGWSRPTPRAYSPARRAGARGRGRGGPVRPAPAEPPVRRRAGARPDVPGVRAGPPSGRPAWRFQSRTLLEFPPAVRDGLVVDRHQLRSRLCASTAAPGKLRWARRQRGEIASTPAITGDAVSCASMDGSLVRYGRRRDAPGGPSPPGSPIESSPLVVGGLVYVGAWNGTLYAVDARTGRAALDLPGRAPPSRAAPRWPAASIVVGDYARQRATRLDARDRRRALALSGGARFYGGPGRERRHDRDRRRRRRRASPSTPRDGAELWRHSDRRASSTPRPAIAGGAVFIGSYAGLFEALDLATGALRWCSTRASAISGLGDGRGRRRLHGACSRAPASAARTYGLDVDTGRGALPRRRRPLLARGGRRAHPVPGGHPDPRCVSRARAVRHL